MTASLNVLVVDDEIELRESVSEVLKSLGHRVLEAQDGEEGLNLLKRHGTEGAQGIRMVLLDMRLPGIDGLEVLRRIMQMDPTGMVLMITAHGNIRDAVEAMREGAANYLEKPVQEADIAALVNRAIEANALVLQMGLSSPRMTLDDGREFIGRSQQMRQLFEMIQRLGHRALAGAVL
ncbi:MAG TPA: response regulator, partial [Bdellovibrionota bacterium]|nr:response regulator [Bdellovibrionota bacterium]